MWARRLPISPPRLMVLFSSLTFFLPCVALIMLCILGLADGKQPITLFLYLALFCPCIIDTYNIIIKIIIIIINIISNNQY